MSEQSKLSAILQKNKVDLADLAGKSKVWFDRHVQDMRRVGQYSPQSLMRGDEQSKGNRIIPGHLYSFIYDAKHKETLPYFDAFPMVFPFHAVKDGFYGLNLHYLPYHFRAKLMDRLLDFKSNKRFDETTKLRLQWSLLATASRFAMIQPCVKHYLYSQVKSPFKAIHSADWATALLLPVEHFNESTSRVWADSLKKIKAY